jgi:hypothetical protein
MATAAPRATGRRAARMSEIFMMMCTGEREELEEEV